MAHEITRRDIQFGIQQAWHGLTTIVETITTETAAPMLYAMEARPLFIQGADGNYVQVETHKQIVSLDDGLPIGDPVGERYGLLCNQTIWNMLQESLGGTKHEIISAGTVKSRSRGFISVKLADEFKAADRTQQPLMNILWGHGGIQALIAKTGITTIVCANTFAVAMRERGDFKLSVKHTRNAIDRIPNMEKAIEAHIGVIAEFQKAMDQFAEKPITEGGTREFLAGFLTRADKEISPLSTRSSNVIDRVTSLFQSGKGNNGRNVADLFNGITDYYTHESSGGDNKWRQFESSEFGSAGATKADAFAVLGDKKRFDDTKRRGKAVFELTRKFEKAQQEVLATFN